MDAPCVVPPPLDSFSSLRTREPDVRISSVRARARKIWKTWPWKVLWWQVLWHSNIAQTQNTLHAAVRAARPMGRMLIGRRSELVGTTGRGTCVTR